MIDSFQRKDRKKDDEAKPASLFDVFRSKRKGAEEVEFVTVTEEKKHLKRVVKPKPMSRKHMSEAYEEHEFSEKDKEITEKVIESVTVAEPAPATAAPTVEAEFFPCVQCGASIPKGTERCPRCNARYLTDLTDSDIEELEAAESNLPEEPEEVLDKSGIPLIHFDAETGTISYLADDKTAPDFMFECSYCGTVVEFDTSRCPICGKKFDQGDTGIVSLVTDLEFDDDCAGEVDCPSCGEHVTLIKGRCPACMAILHDEDPKDPSAKVDPVIHSDNVVFLHLDVETGELNYLQRLQNRLGFEQMTVQLEGIGRGGFEKDWQSLSRV